MTQPLEGIRILEVDNWGFAPSAGAVLADWGADVVKVEPPGRGDPLRSIFGALNFGDGGMVNFMHEQWNRNKRSIALDLTAAGGRDALDELIASSDVFLTNYLPDVRAQLRVTAADVRRVKPDIVYALATGQGSKGPDAGRPSYDYVSAWARAGVGERLTPEGAPFIQQRAGIVDTPAGNFLAGAIAAALVRTARHGEPVDVEMSLLAAGGWIIGPDITCALNNGWEMPPGRADGRGAGPLFTWYECADGRRLVFTMMQPERYWPEVARVLELDALLNDARFDTPEKRMAETDALCAILAERIRTRPREEWAARMNAADVIWGPVQSPNEFAEDVQVVANGYILDLPRADGSVTRVMSSPAQFDGEPIVGRAAAPDLGQDTDAVLTELGWDAARIAAAKALGFAGMSRVLVLSDTHIRADGRRKLPDAVLDAAREADAILHAGDVTSEHVLTELERFAPVHVVLGNNDHGLTLPEVLELELDGVAVALLHDSGPRKGREARMQRRFPNAACVVFGHSHLPLDELGVDAQRLFNPGSPIERRNAPWRSFGWLGFEGGALVEHRIVAIPE